ncbi:MAG: hypothetical protein VYD57_18700 [Pseudomonadota bacterium]|nr:hypothetical protein [Pseudomonadota bacterium]
MTNLTTPQNPEFVDVRQLEIDDPVVGGPDGVDNVPHKQLAERDAYLKARQDGILEDLGILTGRVDGLDIADGTALGRAFDLSQKYNDEGFAFELFAGTQTWRDFPPVDVIETTVGDDTLDVSDTTYFVPGRNYLIVNSDGTFVAEFTVASILTNKRLRASANINYTLTEEDGATISRHPIVIGEGFSTWSDGDVFYSKPLDVLRNWPDGRVVLRRSAIGQGVFTVSYRKTDTGAWTKAKLLRTVTRSPGTRDEDYAIPLGNADMEIKVAFAAPSAEVTERVDHLVLFTAPPAAAVDLIQRPSILAPAFQATNVGNTPTITGSAFAALYNMPHTSTDIQIAADPNFANLVLDTATDYLAAWKAIDPGIATDLTGIALWGDGFGFIVGASGTIRSTVDAGETFAAETAAESVAFKACDGHSTLRVAVGASGKIQTSAYSGSAWGAWTARTAAGSYAGQFNGVAVVGQHIVAVGASAEIQQASDGGVFFAKRAAANAYVGAFYYVDMDASGNVIAVGASGGIQTSSNFAVNWTQRNADGGYAGIFHGVAMDNVGNGVAVGEDAEIQVTADYGATWDHVDAPDGVTDDLLAVSIDAAGNVVIFGAGGTILTSSDRCATLYERTAAGGFTGNLTGVAIDSEGEAVGVGAGGEVQKANRLESAVTSFTVPSGDDILQTNAFYWTRLRYGSGEVRSNWSEATPFATASVFDYVIQPSNQSPADGATNVAILPTLVSSPFEAYGAADTHTKSQWRIASDAGMTNIIYNSGESDDLTSHTLPAGNELADLASYYWDTRQKGESGRWSAFSIATRFTAQARPHKPVITSPINGATGVSLTPTIQTGSFSQPGGGTHTKSQYQIATDAGFSSIVYDSGETSDLTSHTLPSGLALEPLIDYFLRVRQKNALGAWSAWSDTSTFETQVPSGEAVFTSPGNHNFVVPTGVTSLSVVVIGGGRGAGQFGGGGGALGWANDIAVTPGQIIPVTVAPIGNATQYGSMGDQSSSSFGDIVSCVAGGTYFTNAQTNVEVPGGSRVGGDGGGNGGNGGDYGGGGAGGYDGPGGRGATANNSDGRWHGQAGSGGGGGGGAAASLSDYTSGSGGGTGINGKGSSGTGGLGTSGIGNAQSGRGGSNGTDGTTSRGGRFGGGGGSKGYRSAGDKGGQGDQGAVRIIWGAGRSFPLNAA